MPLSINNHFLYYINSNNRVNASDTSSNFSMKIDIPPTTDGSLYDRVVILGAVIPNSFYLIQVGYNTFPITENGVLRTITLTPSNYSRPQLQTELQKQLRAGQPVGYTYSVSFPTSSAPQTGLWTITNGSTLATSLQVGNYLYEVLGFNKGSTQTFTSGSLTSTNIIKLQSDDTIYIMSDVHNGYRGILQEIYCNNASFSFKTFTHLNVELYSKEFNKKDTNSFRFWVTDENFTPLNLNGLNMNMTLCFFQNNNHPAIAKEDIMINSMEKLQTQLNTLKKETQHGTQPSSSVDEPADEETPDPHADGEQVEIDYLKKEEENKPEEEAKTLEAEQDPFYNPPQMIVGGF